MGVQGRTQAPPRLSERDLIALMERHGIGTDATVAEHIQKQVISSEHGRNSGLCTLPLIWAVHAAIAWQAADTTEKSGVRHSVHATKSRLGLPCSGVASCNMQAPISPCRGLASPCQMLQAAFCKTGPTTPSPA